MRGRAGSRSAINCLKTSSATTGPNASSSGASQRAVAWPACKSMRSRSQGQRARICVFGLVPRQRPSHRTTHVQPHTPHSPHGLHGDQCAGTTSLATRASRRSRTRLRRRSCARAGQKPPFLKSSGACSLHQPSVLRICVVLPPLSTAPLAAS